MQITSWNYRSLGNPKKENAVKDLLRMEPSDILLLQETKIGEDALLLLSKTKWKKNSGMVVSASRTSGGLVTLWSEEYFLLKVSYASQHWIFTDLQHIPSKTSLALFNLYVLVNLIEKKDCWTTLSHFIETHSPDNIIVVGDLNIILDPVEKKGGVRCKDHFNELVENLIHAWDLLDFKPKKGRFT